MRTVSQVFGGQRIIWSNLVVSGMCNLGPLSLVERGLPQGRKYVHNQFKQQKSFRDRLGLVLAGSKGIKALNYVLCAGHYR